MHQFEVLKVDENIEKLLNSTMAQQNESIKQLAQSYISTYGDSQAQDENLNMENVEGNTI